MNGSDLPAACPPRYQLWILLRRLRVGVITTRSTRGVLSSRPLLTCNGKHDVGGLLYFFVSADSLWMRDIAHDPNVSIVYADLDRQQFVAVSGAARVMRCLRTQLELWDAWARKEFPGGPADPMLRLLVVDITSAMLQNGEVRHDLSGAEFSTRSGGAAGSMAGLGQPVVSADA